MRLDERVQMEVRWPRTFPVEVMGDVILGHARDATRAAADVMVEQSNPEMVPTEK